MKRLTFAIVGVLFLVFSIITIAIAANMLIDGSFSDWTSPSPTPPAPALLADTIYDDIGSSGNDEGSRDDITTLGSYWDGGATSPLFILEAWDNTDLPNLSWGLTKLRRTNGTYYFIYTCISGKSTCNDANKFGIKIDSCSDVNCTTRNSICSGAAGCSSVSIKEGLSMPDPWPTRTNPICAGTYCATSDWALEMSIPWTYLGGSAPADGEHVFMTFGSVSGNTSTGFVDGDTVNNGVSCKKTGSTSICYQASGPTNLGITSFAGTAQTVPALAWGGLGLAALGLALVGGRRLLKPRAR